MGSRQVAALIVTFVLTFVLGILLYGRVIDSVALVVLAAGATAAALTLLAKFLFRRRR